jgi:hypothetical protein
VASDLNGAFDPAPPGNIGDRDTVTFQGYRFTLIEAQSVNGDFGSWRVYVYDQSAHSLTPLSIRTPGGSTAFGNPTATVVNDPSGHRTLVATLYVFSEGASDGEAGPLIYYKRF